MAALPATTAVVLGVDLEGPSRFDLRRDGPHALVAGTTGAGKSELLQTLVAALAVGNRPDELSFVLVDYKGGAAFGGCVGLPHTVGWSPTSTSTWPSARSCRCAPSCAPRERLLKAFGCNDIDAYQAPRAPPGAPPLARLVVVIDEFRLLAEELPAFVTGLVRVAAVGRWLGVHLVLATQRPAGIVSADIKANVNLRIALRVRDRPDSDDVVDAPDAALMDAGVPGRAVSRSGSQALRAFQVARVTGTSPDRDGQPVVVRREDDGEPDAAGSSGADDDLARLVAAVRAATTAAGITPAPAAWLPPLPSDLDAGDLPPGDGAAIGLVDLPAEQRQPPLRWDPLTDGHLGFCGGPGSGRFLGPDHAGARAGDPSVPKQLHLHVVDAASGRLQMLAGLPHIGTALTREQPRLVARLVERLAEQVRDRLRQPQPGQPAVVLVVDGWDALVEALDALDHGAPPRPCWGCCGTGRPPACAQWSPVTGRC